MEEQKDFTEKTETETEEERASSEPVGKVKKTYQEKKETKTKEREKLRHTVKSQKRTKHFVSLVIVFVILGILGYIFFSAVKKELPQGEDYSQFFKSQGREHINEGEEHPPYISNPPSSGWHYVSPASVGFYIEALADEQVLHNLEHGDIWIVYHPRVSDDVKELLRTENVFSDAKLIITPRETNDFDISVVAWERVDSFNLDEGALTEEYIERIKSFMLRYKNTGPERVTQPRSHTR